MDKTTTDRIKDVFARGRELIRRDSGDLNISHQGNEFVVSWHASGGVSWSPLAVARDKELPVALEKLARQLSDHPERNTIMGGGGGL